MKNSIAVAGMILLVLLSGCSVLPIGSQAEESFLPEKVETEKTEQETNEPASADELDFSEWGAETDRERYFSEEREIEYDFFAPSNRGERISFDPSTGWFTFETDDFYLNVAGGISYKTVDLFCAPLTSQQPFLWDRQLIYYVFENTLYQLFYPDMENAVAQIVYEGNADFIYRPISNYVTMIGLPNGSPPGQSAQYDYYLCDSREKTMKEIHITDLGIDGRNDDALMIIDSKMIYEMIRR
ncbi:MAG: hypothetical protein IJA99_07090 [Oscillospiraceae bacterium]|nr:hypothetical protein [Oscillospiraceae bacterium]